MSSANATEEDWLDLADAITLLRDQIVEAQTRIAQDDRGVRFGLGELTLELGMELARTRGGNGGLRFSVVGVGVSLGGKYEKADKAAHKVTVRLNPHQLGGTPVDVSDED
ncbi:trypco2 family protein [Streptomyces sp. NPDC058228]|uniref:trypco2 family protein n=1 Tax=Streptomyces sp. NPDC058228 TaxID=3346390 RepID=UPI0036EE2CD0